MVARALGPPRHFSARSLERMIWKLKQQIDSRPQPGENAANIIRVHYADAYNRMHHSLETIKTRGYKRVCSSDLVTKICQGSDEGNVLSMLLSLNDEFYLLPSYSPSVNEQEIKLHRKKDMRTVKTCWLLAMAGFLRPSDLERVDLDATTVSSDKVLSLSIVAPKEKRQDQRVARVTMIHSHTDPLLCSMAAFEEYKQRIASSDCRAAHPLFPTIKLNRLLRALQNHSTPIAAEHISKYIKQLMTKVGRPAQAPLPKARGLAATLAIQAGVSVDSIVAHGSWSSRGIFEHYYRLSSATSTNFSVFTLDQQSRSRLTKCNVMSTWIYEVLITLHE